MPKKRKNKKKNYKSITAKPNGCKKKFKKDKKWQLCTNLLQVRKSSLLPPFEITVMEKTTKQKKNFLKVGHFGI